MSDKRLNKIMGQMSADRDRRARAAQEAAARKTAEQDQGTRAAIAWPSFVSMIKKVVDDINLELEARELPKLVLEIEPPLAASRLGQGSVGSGVIDGISDMSFTAWSESGNLDIRIPSPRDLETETLLLTDLSQEKWREYLYDFLEARLRN